MPYADLPDGFDELAGAAVAAIRRAYDINAERHDPHVGDDAVVFGIATYRNSWFLVEREVESLENWTSARPQGSLVLNGLGLRVHVYRHGTDADTDLDSFRLDDERASATQRMIADVNKMQLEFVLEVPEETAVAIESGLSELVIVHAGNPNSGCCGIWIGAPIAPEEITSSPWAWVEPLWVAEPTGEVGNKTDSDVHVPRHDELPEPEIALEPVLENDAEAQLEDK